MGRDLTTGVRAHCVNGVRDSVVIACVWCEIEGLMGVASANNGGWGRCDRGWCCDCWHGCECATGVGASAIAAGAVTASMAASVQWG